MKTKAQEHVTDHAVLRWLERNSVVEVEAIRAQIYSECREALNCGAKRLRVNGTDYRMRGGKVVTLINARKNCRPLNWGRRK